jgi:hypothetical protein
MTPRLRGRRLLTVREFADLADVSRHQVRAMLRDGRLGGRDLNAGKPGRTHAQWRVFASEADRYLRERGGR